MRELHLEIGDAGGAPQNAAAEREALERVLRSSQFQKAVKLSRILSYLCDERFEGRGEAIKEYNIAVEALGRPANFDPQADAIVRVDLHQLRRRLKAYYAGEGRRDPLRIVLPPGSYAPEFVPTPAEELAAALAEQAARDGAPAGAKALAARWRLPALATAITLLAAVAMGAGWWLVRRARESAWVLLTPSVGGSLHAKGLFTRVRETPDLLSQGLRIRCGSTAAYVDSDGLRWLSDRYFSGGHTYQRTVAQLYRTSDAALFEAGREGEFTYAIPVKPGRYEVHLLFAETRPGVEALTKTENYSVNGINESFDLVTDAMGTDTATERVYANVSPDASGRIRLQFTSEEDVLSGIEILPQRGARPNPVRISTLPQLFTDPEGGHWRSERYELGGRNVEDPGQPASGFGKLLTHERYGTFDYDIPVAKGFRYQVTLLLRESYWGKENSGFGGVGSRQFDVRCNGTALLSRFDVLRHQAGHRAVVVRFRNLAPDYRGKLDLRFVPEVNYALVNAISVEAE